MVRRARRHRRWRVLLRSSTLSKAPADWGYHPGYVGVFTRETAPGAWSPGTRIEKHFSEEGDGTPTGTKGTVLGSMAAPSIGHGYFVEWDNRPRFAVFVIPLKLKLADETVVQQ